MAGELREWADIDRTWLKSYLEKHNLATGFELDDELLGSQVSWILTAGDWAKLREAWQEQHGSGSVHGDAAEKQAIDEQPVVAETNAESESAKSATAETPAEDVGSMVAQTTTESSQKLRILDAEVEKALQEKQRMDELTKNALSDWEAFTELFQSCPESVNIGAWEKLADSPVALLKHAEKLILVQEAADAEQKHNLDRELERHVTRAQNIIAGYYMHCRKKGVVPSLEHLLDFVPVMRTGHSPAVVEEAWKREAECQNPKRG